jgi:hypothetical protein
MLLPDVSGMYTLGVRSTDVYLEHADSIAAGTQNSHKNKHFMRSNAAIANTAGRSTSPTRSASALRFEIVTIFRLSLASR